MTQAPQQTDPRQQSLESFLQETTRPGEASGEHEGLVAPGQEELALKFAKELGLTEDETGGEEQQEELILGKFKSPEDLAKAYQQLEKKLGERKAEPEPEPEPYTREAGIEHFGEELATKFEQAGFDPFQLGRELADGEVELDAAAKALAGASGLSVGVAETYLRGLIAKAAPEAGGGISDEQQAEVIQALGGEEAFKELAGWAKANVPTEQLAAYNKVLEAGNLEAVKLTLWAFQALRSGGGAGEQKPLVEPKLIAGGTPPKSATKFESQAQALAAMNKRSSETGELLYETDEAYRRKVMDMVANSDW